MKFDVLKGMVDKSMTRSSAGVVEDEGELGESDVDMTSKMDELQTQLSKTFTQA